MSDDDNVPVEGAPPESAVAESAVADLPPATFGARLKWERERAGLAATDVAARLRLHLNQVRAIEREDLAALPETAYVRGFVRSYARVLNLDAAPLLADLSSRIGTTTPSVVEGMAQHRDYSPVREAAREQASRRIFIAGAVLVLIALGALGWYATRERSAAVIAAPAAPVQVAPSSTAESAPAAAAAVAAVAPVTAPMVTSPPAAEPAVMEPVPPPPLLKLRFSGPSWAEVKDAEGKVLHSQQNVAGAESVIEGTPPFYVVIGDTTKASVEVRGEAYDLTPHTRQNVARFTVN
jgi:cytoskeleton protein RodZ